MARNLARSFFVTAILLLMGPAALAQTDYSPPGQPPMSQPTSTQRVPWDRAAGFRMQCGQDLQRFCNGVQPGEGRLIQCLASHRSELSSECVSRLPAAQPGLGIRMQCGQDLQRFCNGVQPGEGRLIQCLSAHRSQLSPACISRMAAARPAVGEFPTSENTQSPGAPSDSRTPGHAVTESALRASCGPDVQKLCAGTSRENGGVIKCLSTHRMELSPTCDAFFNEMPARRAAQKGPPKSAPPAANRSTVPPAAAGDAAATDAPSAPHGATAPPAAANDAAATDALSAPHGATAPPAAANDAAATDAPSAPHGSTAPSAATDDIANTGAPSAAHGPTAAPAAANGGADAGTPPASTDVPPTSAPPPADSPHAKGALAFPL
jgi:Cysteine rich repeat